MEVHALCAVCRRRLPIRQLAGATPITCHRAACVTAHARAQRQAADRAAAGRVAEAQVDDAQN